MWSQQRKHSCVLGHVEEPPPHRMHLQFFFTNSCISLHPFQQKAKWRGMSRYTSQKH